MNRRTTENNKKTWKWVKNVLQTSECNDNKKQKRLPDRNTSKLDTRETRRLTHATMRKTNQVTAQAELQNPMSRSSALYEETTRSQHTMQEGQNDTSGEAFHYTAQFDKLQRGKN